MYTNLNKYENPTAHMSNNKMRKATDSIETDDAFHCCHLQYSPQVNCTDLYVCNCTLTAPNTVDNNLPTIVNKQTCLLCYNTSCINF